MKEDFAENVFATYNFFIDFWEIKVYRTVEQEVKLEWPCHYLFRPWKNLEINQNLLAKSAFFFYRLFKKERSFWRINQKILILQSA